MEIRATQEEKKITAILLLLQNHPSLIQLLVDVSAQTLSVERSHALLSLLDESSNRTRKFLILAALDIWLDTEYVGVTVIGELIHSSDLASALAGFNYYLQS